MGEPVSHVVQDGARFHVLSWTGLEGPNSGGAITTCSEPMCEVNFVAIHEIKRCGLDPARYLPRTVAALSRSTSKEEGNG